MSSRYARESRGWNLDSLSLCREAEPSALSSEIPIANECCSLACVTEACPQHLSSETLPISTGDPGLDEYIASLPVSRVNLGVWQGSEKGLRTSGGYGQTSTVLCARSDLNGSSWKKCQDLFEEVWDWSSETLPTSGFGTPTTFSAQPTWGRRTFASECSSWPTPNSRDHKGPPGQDCWERGGHQSSLPRSVGLWATPQSFESNDCVRSEEARERALTKGGCRNLREEVTLWGTPTTRDWKDGACAEQNVPTNGLLGRPVCRVGMWATPARADCTGTTGGNMGRSLRTDISSHPDLPTTTAGESSSPSTRRLSPLFVEMLQGFPIGWTDLER